MYIQATTIAGRTKEIERYYTSRSYRGEKRQPRQETTKEAQKRINEKHAVKKLRRLMNANFTNDDLYLTMDCIKEEGMEYLTAEEMKNLLSKFQRKCRNAWKRLGAELRYISVMAVGSRSARHFHLVLSHIPGTDYKFQRDLIQKVWDEVYLTAGRAKKSYIHLEMLYGENYGDLAAYFVKQSATTMETIGEKIGKRWNASRNLVRPVTIKHVMSDRKSYRRELKAPKGWHIDPKYSEDGAGVEYGGYEYSLRILIKDNDCLPGRAGTPARGI